MTESTSEVKETRASFTEKHPYVKAFIDGLPQESFAAYIGLGFVVMWLGALTVMIVNLHGTPTDQEVQDLVRLTQGGMLLFAIGFPTLYGLVNVCTLWRERKREGE